MRGPHNFLRLIRTGATFERSGAMHDLLDALSAPARIRLVARIMGWPFRWLGYRGDPSLPPLTRALTALGPAYVKFGQILSTRPDVVGTELAGQLRMLQDRMPPFPTERARQIVEAELGQPISVLFSEFSEPVAAASIAQVHHARRADTGEEVAVKILRPNIAAAFRRDIDAFHLGARIVELLAPFSRRLRPRDVVSHFESVVQGELDLRLEAASATEFAGNTVDDAGFRLALPQWSLTSRRVMTSQWADGIALGDLAALKAAGHNTSAIGRRLLQLFLRHALRDGLFHGDMHQGNLKVGPDGTIIAYDFGIMGEIDIYTRRVYAEIIYGFIKRDYHRVAEVHFEAGYVPRDRDRFAFARALRAIGEPIFGADASRISMAGLLADLFEVTERFGMQTQTRLILLQRTMVVVEGVARSLDPNINMWEVARPVVEEYVRDNLSPRAAITDLRRVLGMLGRYAPLMPEMADRIMWNAAHPDNGKVESKQSRLPGWASAMIALLAFAVGLSLG